MASGRNPLNLSFSGLRHVHVVGVCGTLMGAFAAYMMKRGVRVSGSDQNVYPPMSDVLARAGVELDSGYAPENLSRHGKPDLVVIGNVIRSDNPEARAAIDGGMNYASLPEVMERLLLPKTTNLVVAGTHGKTTTSSMLAHVLRTNGLKPSYFIGGVSHDLPDSFHVEDPDPSRALNCFVLEGDEYDTAFWDKVPKFNHYLPDHVILTSIEFDHADIYADLQAVIRAFEGLVGRIRAGGRIAVCADYPEALKVVSRAPELVVDTYGSGRTGSPRFTPKNVRSEGGVTVFDVCDSGRAVCSLRMQLPGEHNVLNALAVWIECRALGISDSAIAAGIESFQGVKRRQEVRGEPQGVLVIDDFAHHPTAVRETLAALRFKYLSSAGAGGRPGRLIAVFEPRSATSRRKIFQKEYARAFDAADLVFVAAPYDQSRIDASNQFSTDELVADLQKNNGKEAAAFGTVEQGIDQVVQKARPGDIVAVLSNGGFGGFIPKLIEKISQRAL